MAGNWERMLAELQGRGWRHFCVKMALEIQKRREAGKGKREEKAVNALGLELRGKGWARYATLEIRVKVSADDCLRRSRIEPEG